MPDLGPGSGTTLRTGLVEPALRLHEENGFRLILLGSHEDRHQEKRVPTRTICEGVGMAGGHTSERKGTAFLWMNVIDAEVVAHPARGSRCSPAGRPIGGA